MSWKVEDTPMKWVSLPMPIGMCSHQCLLQEDPSSSIREQLPAKGQNNARFNLKFSLLKPLHSFLRISMENLILHQIITSSWKGVQSHNLLASKCTIQCILYWEVPSQSCQSVINLSVTNWVDYHQYAKLVTTKKICH